MKYEQFDTPKTLLRQLANTDDQLTHMPLVEPEWLDVEMYSCGGHRCWFGDFLHRRGMLEKFKRNNDPEYSDVRRPYKCMRWFFGSSDVSIYWGVFSADNELSTAERIANLQEHRRQLQAQIAAWHEVRRITEVAA